jgi:Rrf2 family transcriptional regulator, iron-sulfur cluster assembly transcription factor
VILVTTARDFRHCELASRLLFSARTLPRLFPRARAMVKKIGPGAFMLSTTSQYAIRALSCLARMHQGDAVLGRDLSRQAAVPENYLSKIMLVMRNAGLVHATRGAGGGYRLARPSASIRLVDIVSLFDSSAAQLECVLGGGPCDENKPCSAHEHWKEVRSHYIQFLEKTTLQQLAEFDR